MKSARQSKIIELIEEYDVMTQEELSELLAQAGYPNTQRSQRRPVSRSMHSSHHRIQTSGRSIDRCWRQES